MIYWKWMKSRWRDSIDWILLNFGWYVDTIHTLRVEDTMFYNQGDLYRVADVDDEFIIIYTMATQVLICAKVNKLGGFILWCRDIKYRIRRWRDNL